jgi:peptidoglycan/LPS O-acetylase OafA/YrhL
MEKNIRRHDIDWLRVIAIGLLLIYHVAIVFQPWGAMIGFIQNDQSLLGLWKGMALLNIWRIPLLFFISGMGIYFAMHRRNLKDLLIERTSRILIPFLFGMPTIVPVHIYIWQKYYNQDIEYMVTRGHLWFLLNIFIYVVVLSPLFYYLKKNESSRIAQNIKKLFQSPAGLFIIIAFFITEALILNPDIYELYAMTDHGFILGFISFFFGYLIAYSGESFLNFITRWKWITLSCAAVLYFIRIRIFELEAPNYLRAVEACLWIFSAFGFAGKYLNRPGNILTYLSKAAYPVYIVHMFFIYLGAVIILPLGLSSPVKFVILLVFTFTGSLISFEVFIKRVFFLRPLFGLKALNRQYKSNSTYPDTSNNTDLKRAANF